MSAVSDAEVALVRQCIMTRLGVPEQQYRFHETRRWTFDLAWPRLRIAVEVEGGTWAHGRHTRGVGYERDCVKYNTAAIDGWLVLRVTPNMVHDGRALETIETAVRRRTLDSLGTAVVPSAPTGRVEPE